jgi:hypothetical protein
MLSIGDLATYTNTKIKKPVRVKIMDIEDGKATVRITSNNHPNFRHGDFKKNISLTSLTPSEFTGSYQMRMDEVRS